jgi:hypothetical protein
MGELWWVAIRRCRILARLAVHVAVGSVLSALGAMPVDCAAAEPTAEVVPALAGASTITVYRPKQWVGGDTFVIELDGIPTVELASREYADLVVSPGTHVVSQHDPRSQKIAVDAQPGQTYFIKAWLGFGIINPTTHLALVAPGSASQEITCCHAASVAAWLVTGPDKQPGGESNSPGGGGSVTLSAAQWIPNAGQEAGWAIYPATIVADPQAIRIDLSGPDTGRRVVRIPWSAIASVEYQTYKRSCWLALRRTSGHFEEFRADECAVLEQFGQSVRARYIGSSHE